LSSTIAQRYDQFYALLENNYTQAERDSMQVDTREEAAQRLASYFVVDSDAISALCVPRSSPTETSANSLAV
jgi:hypothetical protein